MRKVNLDLMVGQKSGCQFRKTTPQPKIIQRGFKVGAAQKSLAINTLLNKFGLTSDTLYQEINTSKSTTTKWPVGLLVQYQAVITGTKTYDVIQREPTTYAILNYIVSTPKITI